MALNFSGGTNDFDDVAQSVMEGRMQLWAAEDACAVTEIAVYPKKKVLHTFLAGGKMGTIVDMQHDAAKWAKLQGCTSMSIAGRAGWERVLSKHDWEPVHVVLSKEI